MKRFLSIMFAVCLIMQTALLCVPAHAEEAVVAPAVEYDYASTYYDGDKPTNTWTYTPFANATQSTFASHYNNAANYSLGVGYPKIWVSNNDTTVFVMIEHPLPKDLWPGNQYAVGFAAHIPHDDCPGDETCTQYAKCVWAGGRGEAVRYDGITMNPAHYATDKIYNKYPSLTSDAVRVMFEFQPYGGEQIPTDAVIDMEAIVCFNGLDLTAIGGVTNNWARMGWADYVDGIGKLNVDSSSTYFNSAASVQVKLAHKHVVDEEAGIQADNANHFNVCALCGEAMNIVAHDNKGVGACTVCGVAGYDYASTYLYDAMPTDLGNETAFANAPKATLSRTYHNNCSLTPAPTIQIVNDDTTVYMNIRTFLKTNYWPKNNYNYAFAVHAPHDDCPGLATCTQFAQYSMSAKGAMNHTASPVDMKATNYANGGDSMIWNSADRNGWMNAKIAFQPFGGETIPEGTIIMMEVTAGNTGDGYLIDDNDTKVWSTYGWSTNATTQISAWSATNFDIPNAVAVKLADPCKHTSTSVVYVDENTHKTVCTDECGRVLSEEEHNVADVYEADGRNHYKTCADCKAQIGKDACAGDGIICTTCGNEFGYDYASTFVSEFVAGIGDWASFKDANRSELTKYWHVADCGKTPAPSIQIVNDTDTVYVMVRTKMKTNYWPKGNYAYTFAIHAPHDGCVGDGCTEYAHYTMAAAGTTTNLGAVDMFAANYQGTGDTMIYNGANVDGWAIAKFEFKPFGGEAIPAGTTIQMELTAGNTGDGYLIDDNDTKVWSTYGWSANATTQLNAWSDTGFDLANAVVVRLADAPEGCQHIETVLEAVEPTCDEPGLTEGVACEICGEVLVPQDEIPALGHVATNLDAVEPTCTTAGATEGLQCSVCGDVLVAPVEIPALGHTVADDAEWVTDDDNHWHVCATCGENVDVAAHEGEGTCTVCGAEIAAGIVYSGDLDENGTVDTADLKKLNQHIGRPAKYPLPDGVSADYDYSGAVDTADLKYLNQHIGRPTKYPIPKPVA